MLQMSSQAAVECARLLPRGEPVGTCWKATDRAHRFQLAGRPNTEHADTGGRGVQHEPKASVLGEVEIRGRASHPRVRRPPVRIQQTQGVPTITKKSLDAIRISV